MVFLAYTHWTRASCGNSFASLIINDMKTKQAVAVIGASGQMGSAIAHSVSKGNYRTVLYSAEPGKSEKLAGEIKKENAHADVEVVNDVLEACWEADIIIIAVPYDVENQIGNNIRKVTNQKIIISVSNPINDSSTGLVTSGDSSAAEELQKLLPNAKVVKAFNTTFAANFQQPVIDGAQIDCFIAGNDESALETVYDLVKTSGFNPVVAGDLSASRTLESMQFLLTQLNLENNYHGMAGWKILHR